MLALVWGEGGSVGDFPTQRLLFDSGQHIRRTDMCLSNGCVCPASVYASVRPLHEISGKISKRLLTTALTQDCWLMIDVVPSSPTWLSWPWGEKSVGGSVWGHQSVGAEDCSLTSRPSPSSRIGDVCCPGSAMFVVQQEACGRRWVGCGGKKESSQHNRRTNQDFEGGLLFDSAVGARRATLGGNSLGCSVYQLAQLIH